MKVSVEIIEQWNDRALNLDVSEFLRPHARFLVVRKRYLHLTRAGAQS